MHFQVRARLSPPILPEAGQVRYFPLPKWSQNAAHGLLGINHEYTDDGLLHVGPADATRLRPPTGQAAAKTAGA